jgi:hypothetical protein
VAIATAILIQTILFGGALLFSRHQDIEHRCDALRMGLQSGTPSATRAVYEEYSALDCNSPSLTEALPDWVFLMAPLVGVGVVLLLLLWLVQHVRARRSPENEMTRTVDAPRWFAKSSPEMKSYRIPVAADEDYFVTFPGPVTPEKWETFMTILNAMKGPILEAPRTEEPEEEPQG